MANNTPDDVKKQQEATKSAQQIKSANSKPGVDPQTGAVVLQVGIESFFDSAAGEHKTTNNYVYNHKEVMAKLDDDKVPTWDDFVKDFNYPIATVNPASLKKRRKEDANLSIWDLDLGSWCGLGAFPWPDPWDFFGSGGQFDADFVGQFNFDYGALAFRWFTFGPPCPLPPVAVGPPPFKNALWADKERSFAEDPENQKNFKDERKNLPPDQVGDYVATSGYIQDLKLQVPSTTTLWKMYEIIHNRLNTETLMQWVCKCFGDLELATVPWVDVDLELGGGGSLGASGGVSAAAGMGSKAAAAENLALGGPAAEGFHQQELSKAKAEMDAKYAECQKELDGSIEKSECMVEYNALKAKYDKLAEGPPLTGGATQTSAFISSITAGPSLTIISSPSHGLGKKEPIVTIDGSTTPQDSYPKNVSVVIKGVVGVKDENDAPADNQINTSHVATLISDDEMTIPLSTAGWSFYGAGGQVVLSAYYEPPTLQELEESYAPPIDTGEPQNEYQYDVEYDPETGQWASNPLYYVPTADAHIKAQEQAETYKGECEEKFGPNGSVPDPTKYAQCMGEYDLKKAKADQLETLWADATGDPSINPENYPAFYGNDSWEVAAAAAGEEKYSAATPPDFPVPMAVAAEMDYQAKAEHGFEVKGGVGVTTKTITLADLCDYCVNWPSIDHRGPTYDMMGQIVSVLKVVLEALLVKFLIALLVALLDWLTQCPDFSCPDQIDPDLGRDVSQDFGGLPINNLLDDSSYPAPAKLDEIFADCNEEFESQMEQYEPGLAREFLDAVSIRLSSGEVLGAMAGAPTDMTVQIFRETMEDEFPDTLAKHFRTLAQIEDLIACLGRSVSSETLGNAERRVSDRMRLPEICDAPPGHLMKQRYLDKCGNIEDVKKFFDREMNLDHQVFNSLGALLRDPDAMADLIPPIFSKPPEIDIMNGVATPGTEGLLKSIDAQPAVISRAHQNASSNLINPVLIKLNLDAENFQASWTEKDPLAEKLSISAGEMFLSFFLGIEPDPVYYKWEPDHRVWGDNSPLPLPNNSYRRADKIDYVDALTEFGWLAPPPAIDSKYDTPIPPSAPPLPLTPRPPLVGNAAGFKYDSSFLGTGVPTEQVTIDTTHIKAGMPLRTTEWGAYGEDTPAGPLWSAQAERIKYPKILPALHEALLNFTSDLNGFQVFMKSGQFAYRAIAFERSPIVDLAMSGLTEDAVVYSWKSVPILNNEQYAYVQYSLDPPTVPGKLEDTTSFRLTIGPDSDFYTMPTNMGDNPPMQTILFSPYAESAKVVEKFWENNKDIHDFITNELVVYPVDRPAKVETFIQLLFSTFPERVVTVTPVSIIDKQPPQVQPFVDEALDEFLFRFYDIIIESVFGQVAASMAASNLWIPDRYQLPPKTMHSMYNHMWSMQFLGASEAFGHMPNWHHALYTRTSPAYINDTPKFKLPGVKGLDKAPSKPYSVDFRTQIKLLADPLLSVDLLDVSYDPEDDEKEPMIDPKRFKSIIEDNYDWSEETDPYDRTKYTSWQRASLWAIIDAFVQISGKEVLLRTTPYISQYGMKGDFLPPKTMIDLIYNKMISSIKSAHMGNEFFVDFSEAAQIVYYHRMLNDNLSKAPTGSMTAEKAIKYFIEEAYPSMIDSVQKMLSHTDEKYHNIDESGGQLRKELFKIMNENPPSINEVFTWPVPVDPPAFVGEFEHSFQTLETGFVTGQIPYVGPEWFEDPGGAIGGFQQGRREFLERGGFIYEPYVIYELNDGPLEPLSTDGSYSTAELEEILFDAHDQLIMKWKERINKNYNFVGERKAQPSHAFKLDEYEKAALGWRWLDVIYGRRLNHDTAGATGPEDDRHPAAENHITWGYKDGSLKDMNPYDQHFATYYDFTVQGFVHEVKDLKKTGKHEYAWSGGARLCQEDCSMWFLQNHYAWDLNVDTDAWAVNTQKWLWQQSMKTSMQYLNMHEQQWSPPAWMQEVGGTTPFEVLNIDYPEPSLFESIMGAIVGVITVAVGFAITVVGMLMVPLTAGSSLALGSVIGAKAMSAAGEAVKTITEQDISSKIDYWWKLADHGHYWKGGVYSIMSPSDWTDVPSVMNSDKWGAGWNKQKPTVDAWTHSPAHSPVIYKPWLVGDPDSYPEWFYGRGQWTFLYRNGSDLHEQLFPDIALGTPLWEKEHRDKLAKGEASEFANWWEEPGCPLTKQGIEDIILAVIENTDPDGFIPLDITAEEHAAMSDLYKEFESWYKEQCMWLVYKDQWLIDHVDPEHSGLCSLEAAKYFYGDEAFSPTPGEPELDELTGTQVIPNEHQGLYQNNSFTGPMETFFQWLEDRDKTDLIPGWLGQDVRGFDNTNLYCANKRNYRGHRLFLKPPEDLDDGLRIWSWHPPTGIYMSQNLPPGEEEGTFKVEFKTCWSRKKVWVEEFDKEKHTDIEAAVVDSETGEKVELGSTDYLVHAEKWTQDDADNEMYNWPNSHFPGFDPRYEQILVTNPLQNNRFDRPAPRDSKIGHNNTYVDGGHPKNAYWENINLSFPPNDARQIEITAGADVALVMNAALSAKWNDESETYNWEEPLNEILVNKAKEALADVTKDTLFEGNEVFVWPPPKPRGSAAKVRRGPKSGNRGAKSNRPEMTNPQVCSPGDFQKGIKQIWANVPDEAKSLFMTGKIRLKDLFKNIKFGMRYSLAVTKKWKEVSDVMQKVYLPNREYFIDWYKNDMAGIAPCMVGNEYYVNFSFPIAVAEPISLSPPQDNQQGMPRSSSDDGPSTGKDYMNSSLWALLSPNLSDNAKQKEGITNKDGEIMLETGNHFIQLWFNDFLPKLRHQLDSSMEVKTMTKFAMPRASDIATTMMMYNLLFFSTTSQDAFRETRAQLRRSFYSVYHGKDTDAQKIKVGWSEKPKKMPTKF